MNFGSVATIFRNLFPSGSLCASFFVQRGAAARLFGGLCTQRDPPRIVFGPLCAQRPAAGGIVGRLCAQRRTERKVAVGRCAQRSAAATVFMGRCMQRGTADGTAHDRCAHGRAMRQVFVERGARWSVRDSVAPQCGACERPGVADDGPRDANRFGIGMKPFATRTGCG